MANQADMAAKPRQQRFFLFQKKTKTAGSHALWKTRAKTRASSLV
ncbi:hypothetical protein CHCC14814_0451 [Bacillus paralicheniformis]|nr:hypothetical protein CHCC14814_0451 [Bacillus paralicheniformis]